MVTCYDIHTKIKEKNKEGYLYTNIDTYPSHVKKCRKDLSNGSNAIRQATPRMVFFTYAWQCCG
eukprot:scaffold1522_cov184-Chaetoceros_neogracile.AAC.1